MTTKIISGWQITLYDVQIVITKRFGGVYHKADSAFNTHTEALELYDSIKTLEDVKEVVDSWDLAFKTVFWFRSV